MATKARKTARKTAPRRKAAATRKTASRRKTAASRKAAPRRKTAAQRKATARKATPRRKSAARRKAQATLPVWGDGLVVAPGIVPPVAVTPARGRKQAAPKKRSRKSKGVIDKLLDAIS